MTPSQLCENPLDAYPAATVACFDPTQGELPRRRLDCERNRAFLGRLGAAPVDAVLIAASTGHGHLRSCDELAEWLEDSAGAALPNTMRMALLRPEDPLADTRRLVDIARRGEYGVVFVRPGTDVSRSATPAEIADNLRPVVRAVAEAGLAVGLYSIPDVSGVPMPPESAAILCREPGGERIVAIKVTEADYDASTAQFLAHPQLRRLKIVQGWDPHIARALRDGAQTGGQRCGITSGPMSLALFQYLHLLERARQGDWQEVAAAQAAVTRLFAAMQDDPGKFADLQRAKYLMGLGQPLTGEVREEQVERVLTALADVERPADRQRLARSLDLMQDGPYHQRLAELV